jgi:hypothetical protein
MVALSGLASLLRRLVRGLSRRRLFYLTVIVFELSIPLVFYWGITHFYGDRARMTALRDFMVLGVSALFWGVVAAILYEFFSD